MNTQFEEQKLIRETEERQRLEDLKRRAFAAYYTHHPIWKEWGAIERDIYHPDIDHCWINERKGVEYVILRNMKGILAVYRVAIRGQLQRLDHYSTEIVEFSI